MKKEPQILGDYNIIPKELPAEGEVNLTLAPIDLVTYWRRCGQTANFIANFYKLTQNDDRNENSLSTVFNEMIENAAKYSTKRDSDIFVDVKLFNTVLQIEVRNTCNKTHYESLKNRLTKLLNHDNLDQLYIEEMIEKGEEAAGSGIGLLLIMKDYNIKIGAKFVDLGHDLYETTMQVYYYMEEEELV